MCWQNSTINTLQHSVSWKIEIHFLNKNHVCEIEGSGCKHDDNIVCLQNHKTNVIHFLNIYIYSNNNHHFSDFHHHQNDNNDCYDLDSSDHDNCTRLLCPQYSMSRRGWGRDFVRDGAQCSSRLYNLNSKCPSFGEKDLRKLKSPTFILHSWVLQRYQYIGRRIQSISHVLCTHWRKGMC